MVCNGLKQRRTAIRYPRMSLGWFFINWATIKFFRHFTVKKTSLPLPAERLSCLYIQWVAYKYECLWIKSLLAPKILVYRGRIKGSETVLRLILSEKNWFPMKTIHQLSVSEVKMLLLTGNIQKAYKVRNVFCLDDRRKSRHFSKLGVWRNSQTSRMLMTFFRSEPHHSTRCPTSFPGLSKPGKGPQERGCSRPQKRRGWRPTSTQRVSQSWFSCPLLFPPGLRPVQAESDSP